MDEARGKRVYFRKHAHEGMMCERPPVRTADVLATLEEPDHDDRHKATKRIGGRTIIVYYAEDGQEIVVRAVSATRRRSG